jgi:hypothetical protein
MHRGVPILDEFTVRRDAGALQVSALVQIFGTWGADREGDERSRKVTGVTVIGVRDHFVAVEAHVVRGQREAMSLSLQSDTHGSRASTHETVARA